MRQRRVHADRPQRRAADAKQHEGVEIVAHVLGDGFRLRGGAAAVMQIVEAQFAPGRAGAQSGARGFDRGGEALQFLNRQTVLVADALGESVAVVQRDGHAKRSFRAGAAPEAPPRECRCLNPEIRARAGKKTRIGLSNSANERGTQGFSWKRADAQSRAAGPRTRAPPIRALERMKACFYSECAVSPARRI
ncbi:MAG: hypothetical protein BWZ10_01170 [candidate division BRC1 bacterium ADurb.BinA364]|nr:MAG: hypothetical protein BWZ10_01170 [candidate division BRC1 bacterium ADurb.BinA364]